MYCYCLLLPANATRGTQQDCEKQNHLSIQPSPVKAVFAHLALSAATRCFPSCLSSGISCWLYLNSDTRLHSVG